MKVKLFIGVVLGVAALALTIGCDDKSEFEWPANTSDAVANYSMIVEASYADSLATAQALNATLATLVSEPSEASLQAAKNAWIASRPPYLQTEVYRFYDGPIDNPTDGPEGDLNAWPLDELYIDYVDGDPASGSINGTLELTPESIRALNGVNGEADVATGYHAIEFLLWGQDQSDDGPGNRPWSDYLTAEDANGVVPTPEGTTTQARRGTYLTIAGDLLVEDLQSVHAQWAPGAAYRTSFEADPQLAFEKILTGMIVLSGFETGGERLQAALDSGNQEDEHSCFSDNTHVDMQEDVRGIQNVWLGTYGSVSGPGVKAVVEAVDPELAARLDAQIAQSLAYAMALQVPFDLEIKVGSEGNARVQALIDSLRAQEQVLFEVFDLFGLSVTIPE